MHILKGRRELRMTMVSVASEIKFAHGDNLFSFKKYCVLPLKITASVGLGGPLGVSVG